MSEREIRSVLRQVLEELDRHARKIVYPSLLGAGIALSSGGCGDGRAVQADTIALPDSAYGVPDSQPIYAAPDMRRQDGPVSRPDTAYMAPDHRRPDAGPIPPYMAPEAGPIPPIDGGPMPPYMPPWPDGAPIPPYMAPDAKPPIPTDGGMAPLYMAPLPDAKK
jgi:hypothetical protein